MPGAEQEHTHCRHQGMEAGQMRAVKSGTDRKGGLSELRGSLEYRYVQCSCAGSVAARLQGRGHRGEGHSFTFPLNCIY